MPSPVLVMKLSGRARVEMRAARASLDEARTALEAVERTPLGAKGLGE